MNEPAADSAPIPAAPRLTAAEPVAARTRLLRLHLRAGWVGLLVFALLGIALEGLHAFKSSAYLGVGRETRRLMWTLAHAHGVGLSLVHVAFAATVGLLLRAAADSGEAPPAERRLELGSRLLAWGALLIPVGFFLGGVVTYEGDPGVGIVLVPVGALLLIAALSVVVWALWTDRGPR